MKAALQVEQGGAEVTAATPAVTSKRLVGGQGRSGAFEYSAAHRTGVMPLLASFSLSPAEFVLNLRSNHQYNDVPNVADAPREAASVYVQSDNRLIEDPDKVLALAVNALACQLAAFPV